MRRRTEPFPARTIGVLSELELIGDGLLKLPFLRALRAVWGEAHISWITTQGASVYNGPLREIVRPLIDKIEEQPAWLADPQAQTPAFDLLFDTRGKKGKVLAARRRFQTECFVAPVCRFLFSDLRPPFFSPRPERLTNRLLQLVELASGERPEVTGLLPVSPTSLEKARQILPEGPCYIGLAPGAGGANKKWPLDHFEAAAHAQILAGRTAVFLLGPNEAALYPALAQNVPKALFPLQTLPEPGLEDTLALGKLLALAVANDSGTSHMLAAAGCPLLSLFGPTSSKKLAPSGARNRIITAQSFGSREMAAIPPDPVIQTINQMLSENARS